MDTLWTVLLNDYFGIGIALGHQLVNNKHPFCFYSFSIYVLL